MDRRHLIAVAATGVFLVAVLAALGVVIVRGGAVGPDAVSGPPVTSAGAARPRAGIQDGTSSRDAERTGAGPGSTAAVDGVWVARTSRASGVPVPALRAYADAELALRTEQPSCHLSWNTLAGIGWIESRHGTIGGRTLAADGRSSRPILGPALDGASGSAAIRSSPASRSWHGDPVWEHAVGPLQFLPSTWARWGADGDGDRTADPNDLDDAALAAGRYLCADGHDLATGAGWNAAVHAYNHDQGYVAEVAVAANTYATRTAGTTVRTDP